MKVLKIILLYLLVIFFTGMGAIHLLKPELYLPMMPPWMPAHTLLIYASGIAEIGLALLLIPVSTRALSAKLIIAMLVVFLFAIHIPQSIDFYQTQNKDFVVSLIRLPVQLVFIGWAWLFARK